MAMAKQIVFFTSKDGGCQPCEEITKLVEEGKFYSSQTDEVDLVDICTDEGFERFNKEVLSKNPGAVPSAYLDGVKCQIMVVDGEVEIKCVEPSNGQPADPEEIPPLPSEDT